ncbi:cell wall protein Ecm33 [Entomophthora muscae]|uniref:Cell wall protein Ecm33 n=1 Tax=Entomophthora muscae TaxID=34485 RepID=A0ACC2T1R2_9FUNG|nr:cell wall protein Ecm33 [Entomophthora muscae]
MLDLCFGNKVLREAVEIGNVFAHCAEYGGSIDLDRALDINIASRKLESIGGQLTVRGKLPLEFRELKVRTLCLLDVKEYEQWSYSKLQVDELIINGFTPTFQVMFTNLNPTYVSIENSNMAGIKGIVSSSLAELTLRNNPNLENFIMHGLTQVTNVEFNQNIKLNLSNAFPNLKRAGNVIITNSGEHDISLPLQVIHDLKVKSNRFALLSLPHLASVHDLSVSENAISTLSLPRLESANSIEVKENKQLRVFDVSRLTDVIKIQVLDEKMKELFLNTHLKWESARFKSPSFIQQYFHVFSQRKNLDLGVPSMCFGSLKVIDSNTQALHKCKILYASVTIDTESPASHPITEEIWGDLIIHGHLNTFQFPRLKAVHGTLQVDGTAPLEAILPAIMHVTNLHVSNANMFPLKNLQVKEAVTIQSTKLPRLYLDTPTLTSLTVQDNPYLELLHMPQVEHANTFLFINNPNLNIQLPQLLSLNNLTVASSGAAEINFNLESITSLLAIQDNEYIQSIKFPHLTNAGELAIQDNPQLKEADFTQLTTVARKVTFQANPSLPHLHTRAQNYTAPSDVLDDEVPQDRPKESRILTYFLVGIPILLIVGGAIYYFIYRRT